MLAIFGGIGGGLGGGAIGGCIIWFGNYPILLMFGLLISILILLINTLIESKFLKFEVIDK